MCTTKYLPAVNITLADKKPKAIIHKFIEWLKLSSGIIIPSIPTTTKLIPMDLIRYNNCCQKYLLKTIIPKVIRVMIIIKLTFENKWGNMKIAVIIPKVKRLQPKDLAKPVRCFLFKNMT